jgi:hypothetical protein
MCYYKVRKIWPITTLIQRIINEVNFLYQKRKGEIGRRCKTKAMK